MALTGGYHVVTGSPVALSTFVPAGSFKQIDMKANAGNAAACYIGPSTVTAAGANAYLEFAAGGSWGHGVKGLGESMTFDFENLYIIGTASDKFHVSLVK